MPYDIVDAWPSNGATPLPKGWYRLESGLLRYWDGQAWAGLPPGAPLTEAPAAEAGFAEPAADPRTAPTFWSTAAMTLGWIATIMVIGLVVSGVHVAEVSCGTLFSPLAIADDSSRIACAAALDARAEASGWTASLALIFFLAAFALGHKGLKRRLTDWGFGHRANLVPV